MMLQIDARKVQVLLSVLQRAPATVAEQLVCEEVAAMLIQLAEGEAELAKAVFVNRKLDHLIGQTLTTRLMRRLG